MMYFLLGMSLSANAFCLWNMNSLKRRVDELDEVVDGMLEDAFENIEEDEVWQSTN